MLAVPVLVAMQRMVITDTDGLGAGVDSPARPHMTAACTVTKDFLRSHLLGLDLAALSSYISNPTDVLLLNSMYDGLNHNRINNLEESVQTRYQLLTIDPVHTDTLVNIGERRRAGRMFAGSKTRLSRRCPTSSSQVICTSILE